MSNPYENRTTSAGYRFPIQKRPRSSDFHQNCIPKEVKERQQAVAATIAANTGGKSNEGDASKSDAVTQDKIWKQAVLNEKKGVKEW